MLITTPAQNLPFTHPEWQSILATVKSLPPLSLVANQLIAQLSDEYILIADLVAVIEQDPAASARLLRLANSALYQLPKPALSLDDAVSRVLGLDITRAVVLGIAFSAFAAGNDCALQNQRDIWLDGLLMANSTRSITNGIPHHKNLAGIAHTGALLANIGMLVLAKLYPARVDRCFSALADHEPYEASARTLDNFIYEEFGFDHRLIAAELVTQWKLPVELLPIVTLDTNSTNSPFSDLAEYAKQARYLVDNHFTHSELLPDRQLAGLSDELYDALLQTTERFRAITADSYKATAGITSSN